MKCCCIFLFLIATLTVSVCPARNRIVGPVGPSASSPEDIKLARSLGITMGHSYSKIRERLLMHSWQPDPSWGHSGVHEVISYPKYPGVLCGDGMDAVCTARLTKGARAILLTVNQASKTIPVVHVDRDD